MSRGKSKKEIKAISKKLAELKQLRKRGIARCVLVFVAVVLITIVRHLLIMQGYCAYDDPVANAVVYAVILALCFVAGPAAISLSRISKQIKEFEGELAD